jgi:hypothetical protein
MNVPSAGGDRPRRSAALPTRQRLSLAAGVSLALLVLIYFGLMRLALSRDIRARFDQLQAGMTRQEVENIMGKCTTELTIPDTFPVQTSLLYHSKAADGSPLMFELIHVAIVDGRMVQKDFRESSPRERWRFVTERLKAILPR